MFLYYFLYLMMSILAQSITGAEMPSKTGTFDYTQHTYENRQGYAKNDIAKQLFEIMITKKSNLAIAPHLTSLASILILAQLIGPYICLLKIRAEILPDFFSQNQSDEVILDRQTMTLRPSNYFFLDKLKQIAKEHNFLIMEDAQFSTIETIEPQYTGGFFKRATWSDLITSHALAGKNMIAEMEKALKEAKITDPRGVVIISQMNSEGNLLSPEYTVHTLLQIASLKNNGIHLPMGIINQQLLYFNDKELDYGMLRMTPGIGLPSSIQDITPQEAFSKRGTDIAIVGAPIFNSLNVVQTILDLKKSCWNEYLNRLPQNSTIGNK